MMTSATVKAVKTLRYLSKNLLWISPFNPKSAPHLPIRALHLLSAARTRQVEFLKAQLASEQTLKAEVEAGLGECAPRCIAEFF